LHHALKTESVLHIVGNETRRKILSLLSTEPHYISQIAKKLDVTQPAILRHLQILQRSGLIESFTERNPLGAARKYYKICDSFELEIALNPQAFKVEERPKRTRCVKYLDKLKVIDELTGEINATNDIKLKASKALEMMKAVDTLLSCEDYDEDDPNCVNCHILAALRKNVSQIIIQVSRGELRSGLQTLTETVNQLSRLPFTKR
jgi:predicted transcriptional regulator